jgi:hypothetical protein
MFDSSDFRQFMGCFATGIAVLTLPDADGNPMGITINSLTSVSLKPPLVLFCLDRTARSYVAIKTAKRIVINLLGESQEAVSRHFADPHHHARPKNVWDESQSGCPVLCSTLGWMIVKPVRRHKAGDHDIFVCAVTDLYKRGGHRDPLLYFHGRYRQIAT